MKITPIAVLATLLASSALTSTACSALSAGGEYPDKDVTFIVPYGPGGSADPMARAFAKEVEKQVGQTLVIRNREGGAATVGTAELVTAKNDGYTVGMSTNSALVYYPMVEKSLPWKTANDYRSLAKIVSQSGVLAVKKDAPWENFGDFAEALKKEPGKFKIASQGKGSTSDLIMREYLHEAGLKAQMVPFSGGSGEAESALLAGRVDANVTMPTSAKPEVEAGRMKVIGVFQDDKMPIYPDATPVNSLGNHVDLRSAFYFMAPKGVPDDVRARLIEAANKAVQSPAFQNFAQSNGGVVEQQTPEQVVTELKATEPTYRTLIQAMAKEGQ